MGYILLFLEIVGTISFSVSGTVTGMKKGMDVFGACMLGLTTAVGGGIIRDLILGITPPATFVDSRYALISVVTSIILFMPIIRKILFKNKRLYETLMLLTDTVGLGVFVVCGEAAAISAGFGEKNFLVIFVAVLTGVGGGVLRDIFAGDKPYIFVKHIYACAAIIGAVICKAATDMFGMNIGMVLGFSCVMLIRFVAVKRRWNLPKIEV